jgi:pyruvate/2-oxoglutarate dehydrogenase complex dihydrolipoamide dehydrogenase (E3) component
VTVVEAGKQLMGPEDAEISEQIRGILEAQGIRIVLKASDISISKTGNGLALSFAGGTAEGSHLLAAMARRPNTDDLGLERAGIPIDAHGFIMTDEALRTGVPGVWALGECNGRGAFTHTSYNDAEIVAANLLDGARRSVRDRITAYALYTDPPLGRAGVTEAEG